MTPGVVGHVIKVKGHWAKVKDIISKFCGGKVNRSPNTRRRSLTPYSDLFRGLRS